MNYSVDFYNQGVRVSIWYSWPRVPVAGDSVILRQQGKSVEYLVRKVCLDELDSVRVDIEPA